MLAGYPYPKTIVARGGSGMQFANYYAQVPGEDNLLCSFTGGGSVHIAFT